MKWLRRISLTTLALVFVLLGAAALVLNTQWGARFALERLGGLAPGQLETRSVQGTLAGPLDLRGASYRMDDGLTVRAGSLRLDVALPALLRGRVIVETLDVSDLVVTLPEQQPREEPGAAPLEKLPPIELPVSVAVRALRIDGAVLEWPGGEPVRLDSLALSGGLSGGALSLERLRLDLPDGSLSLGGRVDTGAGYRTDLRTEWEWRGGADELSGTLEVDGTLDDLSLSLASRPPVDARLEARITGLPADIGYDLTLAMDRVAPSAAGLADLPGPLAGRLAAAGDLSRVELSGWLAAADQRVDIERLAARREDQGRLTLEALELRGRDGARMEARGTVALGGESPEVDLEADWAGVNVPLPGGRVIESPSGSLWVDGRPSDYHADLDARLGGVVPAGQWRVSGQGSTEAFIIETLRAETLEGALNASGRIAWAPEPSWSLDIDGQGLDPSGLDPAWPGSLSFLLATEGRLTPDGPEAEVNLSELAGRLRGRELAGDANIRVAGPDRVEGALNLSSGPSRISARGRYGADTDLDISLDVADAGDWYPGAGGQLAGGISVAGPSEALRVVGNLEGEDLRVAGTRVAGLAAGFDAGLSPDAPGQVDLRLEGLNQGEVQVAEIDLSARGSLRDHELALQAASDLRRMELAASGGWREEAWRGQLSGLTLDGERVGPWRLESPVMLGGGANGAELGNLCLAGGQGRLCLDGRWSPERGLAASAGLTGMPLALVEVALRPVTERPFALDGRLDLDADIELPAGGEPAVDARFSARDAAISLPGAEGMTTLDLAPLEGELRLADRVLSAAAELGLDEAGTVSLMLDSEDLDPREPAAAPIRGRVDMALADLQPLAALMAPLANPAGSFTGQLDVTGTLGSPGIGGRLTLADFGIDVPQAGLSLTDGELAVTADNGGLDIEGRVASGDGAVNVRGEVVLGGAGGPAAEAAVTGEKFQAVSRPGMEAAVSPDLTLTLSDGRLDVGGSLGVPMLRIDVSKLPGGGGVAPSADVVVAGRDGGTSEPAVAVHADVAVELGEGVIIKGYGFDGSATGELQVIEAPGRATLGRGQIEVRGQYKAYGQDLSIRRGRLLFSDTPIENPALNITAVREADEVTAGVRVGGSAQRPDLTLFSEPPLGSESEILSYLVLGRPLERAGAGDGDALASAAASLGTRGGNLLAKQIGSEFGIDDVSVEESEELGGSALTLGQYLSPRLYVSYGVGFAEAVNLIRMRYELSDHWALEAASGREASAAIKFNVER